MHCPPYIMSVPFLRMSRNTHENWCVLKVLWKLICTAKSSETALVLRSDCGGWRISRIFHMSAAFRHPRAKLLPMECVLWVKKHLRFRDLKICVMWKYVLCTWCNNCRKCSFTITFSISWVENGATGKRTLKYRTTIKVSICTDTIRVCTWRQPNFRVSRPSPNCQKYSEIG